MVLTVHLLLLVIALVCFIVAAIPIPARVNLVAVGLAFLTAAFIFP